MLKTEAIKTFLKLKTHADLADLYSHDMECQVNVAQDGGTRVDGTYRGRTWHGWSDGLTTWKAFRIPYGAKSEPHYEDSELKFDLESHVEAIGMTGWDWKLQVSRWVAFDFDAITHHAGSGICHEELVAIQEAVTKLDWVTIRRSTSGTGLHLYVYLDNVPTATHTEHAALARSILTKMSALTGSDFVAKVDTCGGNMWVWHRKMKGTPGLQLIKQGTVLRDVPGNWKDHVKVVRGDRARAMPQSVSVDEDPFQALINQRLRVPLDEHHQRLIKFLDENKHNWWWDGDMHMLVTHTLHLKEAHTLLDLKGIFETSSGGTSDQNCFCFPMKNGAWSVRRYTRGVIEHETWEQDGSGWTRCYLNREPDFETACRASGGLEDPKTGFIFSEAEVAKQAARRMGFNFEVGVPMLGRKTRFKLHKDGRIIVEVSREDRDDSRNMPGWLAEKSCWVKIFRAPNRAPAEPENFDCDDIVRHLTTESNDDCGWVIKSDGVWRREPMQHIRAALTYVGLDAKDVTGALGSSVLKAWKVVNKPFQPEYPGGREWNLDAAQLQYKPTEDTSALSYPSWTKVLQHCGQGLDEAVKNNPWAMANGIQNGAEYLMCWIASLFQFPTEPLPYLFFFGPQNSGKSIFHEALSLLVSKGYQRADQALSDRTDFNGELEGAIICVVEETDLRTSKVAYNRIKDWVTSRQLNIRHLYKTAYHIVNTTHWIQCANSHQACPVFPGDTRITMCYVDAIDPTEIIIKRKLIARLEKEAPDFLAAVLSLEVPESNDRLNIAVLSTEDKETVQRMNLNPLEAFIDEKCDYCAGAYMTMAEFHEELQRCLDPGEVSYWSKIRVGKELPRQFPRGKLHKDNATAIGNIKWKGATEYEKLSGSKKLHSHNGLLEVQ